MSLGESLPQGLGPWHVDWPWPAPLAGVIWRGIALDRHAFDGGAWEAVPVTPPESVHQAAPKRQLEYLGGRLAARAALAMLTGTPAVPGIAPSRAPLWPAGIVGSITHSGRLAAGVVACAERWQGLGVDAEAILPVARAERLSRQILTPGEQALMDALPRDVRGVFATRVFSLKESLFKALFPLTGVRFYFQDAHLVADAHDPLDATTLELDRTLSPDWSAGRRLTGQVGQVDACLVSLIAVPAATG
ncbi:4'-phosphopantetheinyl transferase family protein [Modicisalibacter tunisiensis]|uniref:Enterobactin synthase component D n=1 Tax=Modicisalibacter tunisiensis TaxID=390637 RepID=A0ABS7WZB9_9GAMM|nr:4'-phosphopantetheinyl transferase superfamily protein [Modicisalibacter tunisiensis]MBZ9539092.1 4'-phosphopantetheinyl transferase superfamily protein [Modicisalibacter tunisiensis]MBZ9567509.1 4'-phosphopantetheinyl transferase superfamily protein [Modicisalibacter tunisiensis]